MLMTALLSRRKTRKNLTGVYQIAQGLLYFPWGIVFVTPSSGLAIILPRCTNSGVTLDVAKLSSTFEEAVRGDFERFAGCDIQDTIRRSTAVPVL